MDPVKRIAKLPLTLVHPGSCSPFTCDALPGICEVISYTMLAMGKVALVFSFRTLHKTQNYAYTEKKEILSFVTGIRNSTSFSMRNILNL